MGCSPRQIFKQFRQLPDDLLVMHVGGKSLFSFGLGALLANGLKGNWKAIGWLTIAAGLLLGLPSAMKVLGKTASQ